MSSYRRITVKLSDKKTWRKLAKLAQRRDSAIPHVPRDEFNQSYRKMNRSEPRRRPEVMINPYMRPQMKPRFTPQHKRPFKVEQRYLHRHFEELLTERDIANLKLLGQNQAGFTNYTPNQAVVLTEQSGEIEKSLGQGQQDRLEYRYEREHHRLNKQDKQALAADAAVIAARNNQNQQAEQQEELRHDELVHQRKLHHLFKAQVQHVRHHKHDLLIQHELEEAELLAQQKHRLAAPAA